MKAAIALPQVVPAARLRPLEWITAPAHREQVLIDAEEDRLEADVYRPHGHKPRPGIVMALGANDLGTRDPRAVALADMLARSGFVVLVMSGARVLITPDGNDAADVVKAPLRAIAAFEYLARRPDVDGTLMGFVGVCLGGGTCLLAASQPEVATRIGFVFLIGPYYSFRSLIRAAVSGTSVDENGSTRPWPVRPYALERLHAWLLQALPPGDGRRVRRALLDEDHASSLDLPPVARVTLQLCRGVPPDCADELIGMLADQFLETLAAASPMDHLADLRAPTFIMHAVADGLIPVEESRRLARALKGQVPLRYMEFELFEHVDATRRLGPGVFAREVWRLAGHVAPLMEYAS
jgi:dienelactone hydrolase